MATQAFGPRTTVVGPATGGLLLYALCQKRDGQAAARSEDEIYSMTDGYLVATAISQVAVGPTLMWLESKNTQQHSGITGGSRFLLRKNAAGAGGEGTVLSGDVGWTETAAADRVLPRCSSGDISSDVNSELSLDVDDNATATSAFNVQFVSLVACRGHRYDPAAATTVNQKYDGGGGND